MLEQPQLGIFLYAHDLHFLEKKVNYKSYPKRHVLNINVCHEAQKRINRKLSDQRVSSIVVISVKWKHINYDFRFFFLFLFCAVSTTRQFSIFFLNVPFILSLKQICPPLSADCIFAGRWSSMSKSQIKLCMARPCCHWSIFFFFFFSCSESLTSELMRFHRNT